MAYHTHILFSPSLQKHYIGSTGNLTNRLMDHNSGRSKYTAKGKPWKLVFMLMFNPFRVLDGVGDRPSGSRQTGLEFFSMPHAPIPMQ